MPAILNRNQTEQSEIIQRNMCLYEDNANLIRKSNLNNSDIPICPNRKQQENPEVIQKRFFVINVGQVKYLGALI